jgi:hypothetical protein
MPLQKKLTYPASITRKILPAAWAMTLSIMLVASNLLHGQQKILSCPEVSISDVQTTHLIFDEPISYLDIGSPYFIADTVNQMVKVRHTGKLDDNDRSRYCNITVITAKGALYSIPLSYFEKPNILIYKYGKQSSTCEYKEFGAVQAAKSSKEKVSEICRQAQSARPGTSSKTRADKLVLAVEGIYYREPNIVLKISVENKSIIDFEIDQVLFRLKRNRPPRKLHTYQEKLLEPVDVCNVPPKIRGMSKETFVFVFDRFTPGRKEKLSINFAEKEGGRSIFHSVSRKKLLDPSRL